MTRSHEHKQVCWCCPNDTFQEQQQGRLEITLAIVEANSSSTFCLRQGGVEAGVRNGDGNGRVGGCVRTWPNSGPYALVPGRLTVSRIKAMALSGAFAMREAEKASSDLMYRLHECEVLQRLPGKISSPRSLEEIYKREAISSKVSVGEDYA